MGKLFAYARLFRIEHAVLLAVAVLLSEALVSNAYEIPFPALSIVLLSLAVPVFIEMASFSLNDYLDIKSDKENKRNDRPLVTGQISPKNAIYASGAFYLLGILAAVPLPAAALFIAIVFAALSIAYNYKLKEMPLIGNLYIALSMAIPFIFGNLVVSDSIYLPLLAIAGVALVAGLGREIIKSAEDVKGDVLHRKAKTLPAIIGTKSSCYAAVACYFVLVPICLLPFSYGLPINILAAGLVLLSAISFAAIGIMIAKSHEQKTLKAARKASLLGLAVGLAGYAASLI